jgi:hypothetical protein
MDTHQSKTSDKNKYISAWYINHYSFRVLLTTITRVNFLLLGKKWIKEPKERGTRKQHLNLMDIREKKLYLQIQAVTNLTPLTGISPPRFKKKLAKKNKVGS